jgi:tryptophan synthase alpha chain
VAATLSDEYSPTNDQALTGNRMKSGGTGNIGKAFALARAEGRAALVPFLTAGYPTHEACLPLLVGMADAGADVIELGVPFSDPVADGPTIQRASEVALEQGTTLERALALAGAFRRERTTPLVLFTYLNPLLRRGIEAAARDLARAGADGVLVCDLPPEEAPEIGEQLRAQGLDYVTLVAPTSSEQRVRALAQAATGFVYVIARTGVTGAGGEDARLARQVAAVRRHTRLPVVVGFGIADAESARRAAGVAEGVVVGSGFLDRIAAAGPGPALDLLREIRMALTPEPAPPGARLTSSTSGS